VNVCGLCKSGELHVCPRETTDPCEWCSCEPAVRYVRVSSHGCTNYEDWLTLCGECRDALRDGLKRAVRRP
jgi:hypothetical protein